MDRNICDDGMPTEEGKTCLVAWNSNNRTSEGPVTAMTYLNNATSSWENIDNLNIEYNDEGGNFEQFAINGKARLPYKREVSNYNSINKTNAYLYDYLSQSGTIQTNIISGISGYWTLSSSSSDAIFLNLTGYYANLTITSTLNSGVRPVINLKL